MSEKRQDRELEDLVAESFRKHFGQTPVEERVADVQRQMSKLSRYVDSQSLRESTGDLLCAVIQLANEHQWDAETLVKETLERIDRRHETYKKFGRRLQVGILGGAFDPIHLGHLEMSRKALESGCVDEVWWMPCYSHLAGKRMATPEHRLAMCHAAAEGIPSVRVFDFEIRHRFLGEIYHLAKRLVADEEIESRYVLNFLIGRENVESMHAWSNFESLKRLMPVLVVGSSDLPEPPADAWYRDPPHHYLDQSTAFDSSSTSIRRGIANGDHEVEQFLPPPVLNYIREHDLYQTGQRGLPLPHKKSRRVAAMIGSFDPPTSAQVELVQRLLSSGYDAVKIFPSAHVRGGLIVEHAEPVHRAALIDLTFGGRPRVEIDFRGLEDERAVAPATLTKMLSQDDLWFVVNEDAVAGDAQKTDLRNQWQEGDRLWNEAGFVIVTDQETSLTSEQLPPRHQLMRLDNMRQPHELRQQLAKGVDVSGVLPPVAKRYIERHRLFQPLRYPMQLPVRWESPRIRLVYDDRNRKAAKLADRYRRWEGPDADFILVIGGDGTMLHAIRQYWRLRLPFIGINAGHLGFLMNQKPFDSLDDLDVVAYRMPMLRALVTSTNGELKKHLAFSDAWIERQTGQAAWFELTVDGEARVPKIVGDGLLVATPSGSSSYARAMGATPVPLDTQSLTIAGSNIFRPRFWQPLMMPADAVIQIRTLDHSGKRPVQAYVDGVPAGIAESMQVRRSHVAAVELAFRRDGDLASKLLASLLPSDSDSF
ncbi:MAG: hypothetical protein GY904_18925 [Planctomycetaceae bacterium]|nr:hypothetical protein [Planctomycetaceae bacterium]